MWQVTQLVSITSNVEQNRREVMGSWTIWLIIGVCLSIFARQLLIPAAIIFGIGLGFGWW